jgi:hypothetical protein
MALDQSNSPYAHGRTDGVRQQTAWETTDVPKDTDLVDAGEHPSVRDYLPLGLARRLDCAPAHPLAVWHRVAVDRQSVVEGHVGGAALLRLLLVDRRRSLAANSLGTKAGALALIQSCRPDGSMLPAAQPAAEAAPYRSIGTVATGRSLRRSPQPGPVQPRDATWHKATQRPRVHLPGEARPEGPVQPRDVRWREATQRPRVQSTPSEAGATQVRTPSGTTPAAAEKARPSEPATRANGRTVHWPVALPELAFPPKIAAPTSRWNDLAAHRLAACACATPVRAPLTPTRWSHMLYSPTYLSFRREKGATACPEPCEGRGAKRQTPKGLRKGPRHATATSGRRKAQRPRPQRRNPRGQGPKGQGPKGPKA